MRSLSCKGYSIFYALPLLLLRNTLVPPHLPTFPLFKAALHLFLGQHILGLLDGFCPPHHLQWEQKQRDAHALRTAGAAAQPRDIQAALQRERWMNKALKL